MPNPMTSTRAWKGFVSVAHGLWRRRWARFLTFGLSALLVLVALIAGAGLLWLRAVARAALPTVDGDLHLPGLSAPVLVRRDLHGVPHIDASSQSDLFLAQGYVTAQERLWQMDTLRRASEGELAEVLGPSLVERDRMQRVLRFRATAERVYEHLDAGDRARVDAYARGVNLFIVQHGDRLPPEFRLLAYRPRSWTGVDSIAVGLLVVQMLDTHWETKLAREHVAARLKSAQLEQDLYPVGSWRDRPPTGILHEFSPPLPPRAVPDDAEEEDDDDTPNETRALPPGLSAEDRAFLASAVDPAHLRALLGLPAEAGLQPGSNNWVVSGAHTASGRPLLSNDMHLGLDAPGIWYMADLKAPGYHAAGVTLPGMPYVIEGHNEHVAWGITALMGDVQDLYIEKLDGKGNFERNDTSWAPLHVENETIHVRGGRAIKLKVELTDHGPLLNPVLPKEKRAIALKWTLYDAALNAMPVYRVNTASNWAEFSSALADWCWPTLNIVYADDQGHIAYHAVGRVPTRMGGAGIFITPVRHEKPLARYEWGAADESRTKAVPLYIPFDQMPNAVDPPSGFLATANARVETEKNKYPLTDEWIDPYRVERIYKALEDRNGLTPKDMLAVQTDVYSEMDQQMGQRIAYAILHTPEADERLRQAAQLLRDWDGRLTTDSAAASIVTETRKALWPLILEPKLGHAWTEYRWGESDFAEEEIVMRAKPQWLSKRYKNWDELLVAAVRKGMADGKAPADLRQWAYGDWHLVEVTHPLAKYLPFLRGVLGTGRQPLAGDTTTVKQAGYSFGPSQRFTMDWSDIDGSTANIVMGESGNPLSPWFRDQWSAWYGGTTFPLAFSEQAIARQARHTLRLLP